MKQWVVAFGLLLVLTAVAAPTPAQTRVSVAVGFRVPRPYVSGVVVVGRPYFYRPFFYRRPVVIVFPPPHPAYPRFVEHVVDCPTRGVPPCACLPSSPFVTTA